MSVVLTPILKNSVSEKLNHSSSRVKFNLPDEDNVIEYLQNSESSHFKLNSVTRRITAVDTPNEVLLRWFRAFKDNILFLEHNEKIAVSLMSINWYSKDDNFISIYQDLILNLVTAHPMYMSKVLVMIVKIFYTVQDSNDVITDSEERCYQNGHKLLQNVIKLVPLCEYPLCALLSEKFPYMKKPTKTQFCYVQNLLRICTYFPKKRLIILEVIVQKLIHIDGNSPRETIELFEMQREEEKTLPMDSDLNSDQADNKKETMAFPLAQTLDTIMDLMYKYIQESCFQKDKSLDWEFTKKLYKELLAVFDKIILQTFRCSHVQYLMFYICSFKQEICDGFLDYLWKKVQNPSIAPVCRQIASFYIGSFLARAKYINISTVAACLQLMCNWIHSYIDNHTAQDLDVHGAFHSVCQTVFYVFAFRSQELIELDKEVRFLRGLNFERIVTCRLNPLRYCDRNIVQNFANIARNFQIAYVYPVIEKNNRNLLYSSQETSAETSAGAMIRTFFPFDPYLLKRSKHWIEANYRIYNHCHKDEELMDTIDEDEINVNDSLFSYGTSPGFKKSYLSKR